jgi:lysozyme
MPTITKRIWDPTQGKYVTVNAATGQPIGQQEPKTNQEELSTSGQDAVNYNNANNPNAGASAPQPNKTGGKLSDYQQREFESILTKATNQTTPTYDESGILSGERSRFQSVSMGGEFYTWDAQGNLVPTGERDISQYNTRDEYVGGGEIIGIDAQGRRFKMGEVEARDAIQNNVVMGANPGGTQTRGEAMSDLRLSAQAGGRPSRSAQDYAPSSGSLTGQEKLSKYYEAGIMQPSTSSGETMTADQLVNYNWADDILKANQSSRPRMGRGEDPKDYALRVAQWEAGIMRGASNKAYAQYQLTALKSAIDAINSEKKEFSTREPKSPEDVIREQKQYADRLEAKQIADYEMIRKQSMNAAIESRTEHLSGSTKARDLARRMIEADEKRNYERDVQSANAEIRKNNKTAKELMEKKVQEEYNKALVLAQNYANMSPEEAAKAEMDAQTQNLADELTGMINPVTGTQMNPVMAKAYAQDIMNKFPNQPEQRQGFVDFVQSLGSGAVNTLDPATVASTAASMAGGGTTMDTSGGKQYMEILLGKTAAETYQNAMLEGMGISTETSTSSAKDSQLATDALRGTLNTPELVAYMSQVEAEDQENETGRAPIMYQQMLDSGVYDDDPEALSYIQKRMQGSVGKKMADRNFADLNATEQENILALGKMVYGTRISDEEGGKILAYMNNPEVQGKSRYDLTLRLLGYVPKRNKDVGETLINMLSPFVGAEGLTEFSFPILGQQLDSGNIEGAINMVEKFVSRKAQDIEGDGYFAESLARQTIQKSNEIQELFNFYEQKGENPVDVFSGKMSNWLGKFRGEEAARLKARIVSMTAEMRKRLLGSAVTSTELRSLEPLLPDIDDSPANFVAKLEEIRSKSLIELNSWRATYGLPELGEDSLLDTQKRKALYGNMTLANMMPGNTGGFQTTMLGGSFDFISEFEGFSGEAYQDPAGVWTVGHGLTSIDGQPVTQDTVVDQEQSMQEVQERIFEIEQKIGIDFPSLNMNQITALTSFMYNLGTAPKNAERLFSAIASGDESVIREEWVKFNKIKNPATGVMESLDGLIKRRRKELETFFTPVTVERTVFPDAAQSTPEVSQRESSVEMSPGGSWWGKVWDVVKQFGMGPAFDAISGEDGALTNLMSGSATKDDAKKAFGAISSILAETGLSFIGGGTGAKAATRAVQLGGKEAVKRTLSGIGIKGGLKVSGLSGIAAAGRAGAEEGDTAEVMTAGAVGTAAGLLLPAAAKGVGFIIPRKAKESALRVAERFLLPAIRGTSKAQSLKQATKEAQKMIDGGIYISNNVDNLTFTDSFGATVSGRLPQDLMEAASVAERARVGLYNAYNQMTIDAGQDIMSIPGKKVVDAIKTPEFVKKLNGLKIRNKTEHKEVLDLLKRIEKEDFSTESLQELIESFSADLGPAFQKGQFTAKESVEAGIYETARDLLDKEILSALGERGGDWAVMRQNYGAIRELEKGIVKRMTAEVRKSGSGGLLGATDVFSSGELVAGVISGNPSMIARGTTQALFKKVIERNSNPNRQIRLFFEQLQKAQ